MGRRSRRLLGSLAVSLLGALALAPGARADLAWRSVQVHPLWADSTANGNERELDLALLAGANSVRADIGWASLESDRKGQRAQWYLDDLDTFMAAAQARGLRVIATLWQTPCWASTAPDTLRQGCRGRWWDRGVTAYPPRNPWDYADMAKWLTTRYGTELAALEIWNEPNLSRYWRATDPAGAYATMVRVTYQAAKEGDLGVPVLAGSLAGSDRPFLEALYADGIRGFYDAISVHPYNDWRAPSDPGTGSDPKWQFLPGLRSIHAAQKAAGDGTPVWATEFGWTTCAPGAARKCVSEKQQADYLFEAIGLLDELPWVKAATVYNLHDTGTDAADPEQNFGIVNRDLSPKLGWFGVSAAFGAAATP